MKYPEKNRRHAGSTIIELVCELSVYEGIFDHDTRSIMEKYLLEKCSFFCL